MKNINSKKLIPMFALSRIAGPLTLLVLIVLSGNSASAQHVPGGRKKTDSVPVFRHTPPTDSMIETRLVTLALEGPRYEASGHQMNVTQSNLSKAKRSWLNLLSISANYNDQTFAKQTAATGAYVYPKYFFGLTIPIGLFFSMGPDIRGARENVEISRNNREQLARTLRTEVLGKYKQYKNFGDLILLQNTIVVDQQAGFTQIEKKFRDGTTSIDQYNLANKSYSDERVKMLNLQLSQDLIRLDIEQIIGVNLDAVTR
jgi:outer membrane protein TolC